MFLTGCSKQDAAQERVPENLRTTLREVAKKQSTASANAKCAIQEAYLYDGPRPFPRPPNIEVLAVVIEISGYADGFDFDDIDLIDADTGENYGSDPGLWPLTADGLADVKAEIPAAPGPATVLLLYGYDKVPRRIKLGYWGKEIVTEPAKVADSGRALFPAGAPPERSN